MDDSGKSREELLTFAKGGAPVKRLLSLGELVCQTVDFALSDSKLVAEVTLPEELWPVEADEGQLVQVFNNLLLNAQQAMPDGGTLEVSGENVTVEGDEPAAHGFRGVLAKPFELADLAVTLRRVLEG
jgi:two-component system cell cycle sensor histidine kinase/response regulator CckA